MINFQVVPPNGGTEGDNFGVSVSLSANTFAVGASGDSSDTGAVYMYGFAVDGADDFAFPLQAKLAPSELEEGSLFGSAVALYVIDVATPEFVSPATLVAGAPGYSNGTGAAFVYTATDSTDPDWGEGVMLPAEAGMTSFGQSVAIFDDLIAVGGVTSSGGVVCVYRYDETSGNWTLEDTLMASDASAGDGFGFSVSLYRDLTSDFEAVLLLVGAPSTSSAYIKIYDPRIQSWIENSKLSSASAGDQFGYSVSVYEGTLAIGSPQGSSGKGGVSIYSPFRDSSAISWRLITEVLFQCTSISGCFINLFLCS